MVPLKVDVDKVGWQITVGKVKLNTLVKRQHRSVLVGDRGDIRTLIQEMERGGHGCESNSRSRCSLFSFTFVSFCFLGYKHVIISSFVLVATAWLRGFSLKRGNIGCGTSRLPLRLYFVILATIR